MKKGITVSMPGGSDSISETDMFTGYISINGRYFGLNGSGTGINADPTDPTDVQSGGSTIMPYSGTLSKLYGHGIAPGAGETFVLTVYKNTVAQSLSVTIADLADSASDLINTVSFVQGDLIAINAVRSGGATAGNCGWTIQSTTS